MEESAPGENKSTERDNDRSLNATAAPFVPGSSSASASVDSLPPPVPETTTATNSEPSKGISSGKKQEKNPQKGPKQVVDARALLGFHYERSNPNYGAFTSPPHARRQKRSRGYSLSKSEYVQAK